MSPFLAIHIDLQVLVGRFVDELGFHSGQGFLLPGEAEHGVSLFKTDPFVSVMFVVQRDISICGHRAC
jgi:hypothetical protein